jgi:cell division protease FtsH
MAKQSPLNSKESKKKPSTNNRFFIFIGLTMLAIFAAGQFFNKIDNSIVPYSDFKKSLKSGEFSKVIISGDVIEATLKHQESPKVEKKIYTMRLPDDDLVPTLEKLEVTFEAHPPTNGLGEFFTNWVLPLLLIFFLGQFFMGRLFKQGPPGLAAFGKSKARLVAQKKEATKFKDVAGAAEAKEELQEIIEFLKSPQKFKDIGGRIPKGVLLVGPPGTGKTLLARAVAGESGVAFMQLSGSDFVEMFVGVGAARVRDLFSEAQKNSPCIVFIDELDAIAKSRGMGGFQTNDEREQTLNQILVEMDGFDNHQGVIIMAATNRPEVLDPAILRPGRFDRQITVNRPDVKEREEILVVHSQKVKKDETVDLKKIAVRTPGFSGADLANLVNEAALLAVRRGLTQVNSPCLEEAIDRVMAGLAKKNRVINVEEKKTIAVHELGHALVSHFSPGADKVHRISIVPRSSGALGFTMQIPEEDRHLMTEKQLKTMIRVLLGGRAAEKEIIGEISSGAQDDLRRATSIARRMIFEFGMGASVGLVSLSQNTPGFLDNPFLRDDSIPVSEELAKEMDKEMRSILDTEFKKAVEIIRQHQKVLEVLKIELLEKETLEAPDFERVLRASEAGTSASLNF